MWSRMEAVGSLACGKFLMNLCGALCLVSATPGRAQNEPAVIEFACTNIRVSEITRTITLPLRIVGGHLPTTPTVGYATQDATATAKQDYVPGPGQAGISYNWDFAPDPEMFVLLAVLDDILVEGDEYFTVTLSNPGEGIILGTNITAVVTIVDNDTASGPGRGANDVIRTGAMLPDGRVVIAGDFTSVDGIPRNGLARLKVDGSLDASFDPGIAAYAQVETLAIHPDGKLLVGGWFTNFGGLPRQGLARLKEDGSLDEGFSPTFRFTATQGNGSVKALVLDGTGRIFVGGYYDEVNGISRRGIARLQEDGSVDGTFAPNLFVVSDVAPIALQADGQLLVNAHLPGDLNEIHRLETNGSTSWFRVPYPYLTAVAYEMVALPDGKILIGGYLSGSVAVRRFGWDGSFDSTFTPAWTGSRMEALVVQPDGKILVGGAFSSIGGSSQISIARLFPDGRPDPDFTPLLNIGATVTGVFVQPDGHILIAGSFTQVNHFEQNRIARLDMSGHLVDGLRFRAPVIQTDRRVRVTLDLLSPQQCLIQASEDLRTWTNISTNFEPTVRLEFMEENAGVRQRYYRALLLP